LTFLKECGVSDAEFCARDGKGAILYLREPKCTLDHRCVVCDNLTLPAGQHSPRAPMDASNDLCHVGFNVRCSTCRHSELVPDPNVYKAWSDLTDREAMSGKSTDGRKIWYELQ
jgi:hypothetical protein